MTDLNNVRTQKLTDWENEPSLRTLRGDLDNAKLTHDAQVAKIHKWSDLLKIEGSAKPVTPKGRSKVQPKLVRRQAEWRYSALTEPFLSSYKLFKVEPRTFEDDAAAKQNEVLLNYQFDIKINKQKFIDDYVRTTVDEGSCIIQLGWQRITKQGSREEPVFDYYPLQDQNQMEALQQAMQLKEADPNGYDNLAPEIKASAEFTAQSGQPVSAVMIGTQQVPYEVFVENKPTLRIHNPANVYIDPSCEGEIDKAKFIVVAFETCKADLVAEGRYTNLDQIDWSSTSVTEQDYYTTKTPDDFQFKDNARRKCVAFEYWGFYDIHGNDELVPIVATWIGDTLIRMEENPFPDEKLPFVVTTYLPVKRELYGEPDAELLEDNQAILGAVTRGMIDSLGRSANAQQGFAKGFLDPLNKKKFMMGEDYEFNPSMPPQQAFVEHQYPELPQSAMLMLQMQNQEAEALTGVKAFSGGVAGDAYAQQSQTSATAVRGVLDAASKREMGILRRLAKGMAQIGEKIVAMNAVFLADTEVVRITNRQFVPIRREDLKGNFDLQVDISTAEIDNSKSQDLSFILQTLGPNTDPQIYMKILSEICELKRMPTLAEWLRTWKPEPDPIQQAMQQAQLQLLQAQIQLTQAQAQREMAEAQKAGSDAQVNGVKAQTEQTKMQTEQAKVQNEMAKAQVEMAKIDAEVAKSQFDAQSAQVDAMLKQAQANKLDAETQRIYLETYEEQNGINHERNLELQRAQARGNQNLEVLKGIMKSTKPEESKPDVEAGIGFNVLTDQADAMRTRNQYA